MDGTGRWMENVFIERLWRSLKYEQVYLAEYATASAARAGIGWWIDFYNERRPHSSLVDRDAQRGVHSGGYSGTGALPRPITARGGLTYDPGLHLNLAAELSDGWGPPLASRVYFGRSRKEQVHCGSRSKLSWSSISLNFGVSGRLRIPGDTESANDLLVGLEAHLAEARTAFLNCSKAEQEIQGFESNYWMCCVRRQKP